MAVMVGVKDLQRDDKSGGSCRADGSDRTTMAMTRKQASPDLSVSLQSRELFDWFVHT